jgi:hypothetical protein
MQRFKKNGCALHAGSFLTNSTEDDGPDTGSGCLKIT